MDKVKNLGQVYTPLNIIELMFKMSIRNGDILEPSAGKGYFTDFIKENSNRDITSIEIDIDNKRNDFRMMDFFDLNEDEKYPTIIGNPPYVSFKNINKDTLDKIQNKVYLSGYDNRTNLYIFFIRKCIEHLTDDGEIIFITPREFIKATSSIKLNHFIYENGGITDWYEYGDDTLFKGYSPNVVIWRFEKNNFERKTKTNDGIKNFTLTDGQISFVSNNTDYIKFSDIFFVKVGAVSGMDDIFTSEKGNMDFVCSFTKKTGKLKKMFYNIKHDDLNQHYDKLINRKIKKFNQNNWWQWGRGLYESDSDRIYVNCKTRDTNPFFSNDCKNYDGSVLAIFPKNDILNKMGKEKVIHFLNNIDWNEMGFKVGGRLCFTQKSLENTFIPKIDERF